MNVKNLGNVAGVVRSNVPPLEADGITEKRYVIWAKTLNTQPISYALMVWSTDLNSWQPLSNVSEQTLLEIRNQVFGSLNPSDIYILLSNLNGDNLYEIVKLLFDTMPNKADLVNGVVPISQLPSYMDDVLEFVSLGVMPVTGEKGKIYITTDDNKQYRWSGSAYINITQSEQDTLQSVTNRGNITTNDIIVGGPQGQAELKHVAGFGPALWLGNNFRIDYTAFNDRNRIITLNKILEFVGQGLTKMVMLPSGEFGINVGLTPSAILHTKGTVKHENLTNAQGDDTFTKQVVAKADGTFGVEDKDEEKIISKTYAQLQALISTNALVIGQKYL